MGVEKSSWGAVNGVEVQRYVLSNASVQAAVLSYGATLQMLKFAGKDVVLGYDTLEGYRRGRSYQGAAIGRYANRIAAGKFELNGKTYDVGCNENGKGHLHGGNVGFDKRVWNASIESDGAEPSVKFTLTAADGEEGYPGNLQVSLTYTLTAENALRLTYTASADADTVVNLTNHSYFNLNGWDGGDILDTQLQIFAEAITPIDKRFIPTGVLQPVEGTPFDFRTPKAIGRDNTADDEQLCIGGGYDHNFVLGTTFAWRHAVRARSPKSGICMDCYTDQPGVQLYTSNGLNEPGGKGGLALYKNQGFCLETQCFPDSPNQPSFPTTRLNAGETRTTVTEYRFSR